MITQIGAAVREERLKRRLSIRELAELSGTSPATISRLENGKVRLMSNGIRKILKVLDISEDDGEKRIQRIIDILKAEDEAENDYNDAYTRGISHGINFALALLTGEISLDEVEHAHQTSKNYRAYERAKEHFDEDIDYLLSFAPSHVFKVGIFTDTLESRIEEILWKRERDKLL